MNSKTNKGITLIALVITIIVLLILAGVTINMVLGDDGIIANAQLAAQKQSEKSKEEIISLAVGGAVIHEHTDTAMTFDEVKKYFDENETVEIYNRNGDPITCKRFDDKNLGLGYNNNIREVVTVTLKDEEEPTLVPIPVGFAILEGKDFSDGCYAVDALGNIFKWSKIVNFADLEPNKNNDNSIPWMVNYGGLWCVYEEKATRDDVINIGECEMHPCEGCNSALIFASPEQAKEHIESCTGEITYYCEACPLEPGTIRFRKN